MLRLAVTWFQRLQDMEVTGVGCSILVSVSLPVSTDRLDFWSGSPEKRQPWKCIL